VSLLEAAFQLSRELGIPLPRTIAMVTLEPARMVGLSDRGSIEPGQRADLLEVDAGAGFTLTRQVWREGVRIA